MVGFLLCKSIFTTGLKTYLMRRLLAAIFFLYYLSAPVSAQIQTAVFQSTKSNQDVKFTMIFKAIDNVLAHVDMIVEGMERPLRFRVYSRISDGFYIVSNTAKASETILLLQVINKMLVLSNKEGKWMGNLSWVYDGPTNGVGTGCADCINDKEALLMLRAATANH